MDSQKENTNVAKVLKYFKNLGMKTIDGKE